MTEREFDWRDPGEGARVCSVCGTSNLTGDRYCGECGALLPLPGYVPARQDEDEAPVAPMVPEAVKSVRTSEKENPAWILGARPTTVIGGGILLLLLAAGLMALGQLEGTGTIVMLSICTAPLGLLVLVIGIARSIGGSARRKG